MTEEKKKDNNPDTIEFGRKKSQNGILYKNNNDVTKTIRVAISDWKAFSTLSLFENTTRSELFKKMLSNYLEHDEDLSNEQRSLILSEINDG